MQNETLVQNLAGRETLASLCYCKGGPCTLNQTKPLILELQRLNVLISELLLNKYFTGSDQQSVNISVLSGVSNLFFS